MYKRQSQSGSGGGGAGTGPHIHFSSVGPGGGAGGADQFAEEPPQATSTWGRPSRLLQTDGGGESGHHPGQQIPSGSQTSRVSFAQSGARQLDNNAHQTGAQTSRASRIQSFFNQAGAARRA